MYKTLQEQLYREPQARARPFGVLRTPPRLGLEVSTHALIIWFLVDLRGHVYGHAGLPEGYLLQDLCCKSDWVYFGLCYYSSQTEGGATAFPYKV